MGLIDQLNYNYEYKTPLTKELLLNFADDLDEYMAKEMPSSSHQGEARKIIEELLEYNTDTSTHSLSHKRYGNDIVRYSREMNLEKVYFK